jgi:hypothetical protein
VSGETFFLLLDLYQTLYARGSPGASKGDEDQWAAIPVFIRVEGPVGGCRKSEMVKGIAYFHRI